MKKSNFAATIALCTVSGLALAMDNATVTTRPIDLSGALFAPFSYQNLGCFTHYLQKLNCLIFINDKERRILFIDTKTNARVELSGLYRGCSSDHTSIWVESWADQNTIHRLYSSINAQVLVEVVAHNTPKDQTKFDRLTVSNNQYSGEIGHGLFCSCRFFPDPGQTHIDPREHSFSTEEPLFGVVAHSYDGSHFVPHAYYFNAHTGQLEYAKNGSPYPTT